jgi:hypothetical protein
MAELQDQTCLSFYNPIARLTQVISCLKRGRVPSPNALSIRLPVIPGGLDILTMGLRTRTLNALTKAGFDKAPQRLNTTPLIEILKLDNFGLTSLEDLISRYLVASSNGGGTNLTSADGSLHSDIFVVPRNFAQFVRTRQYVPREMYTYFLPSPPPGLTIGDLGLKIRTYNVLEKRMHGSDLSTLGKLTVGYVLGLPAFGATSLADLVDRIYESLDSDIAGPRTQSAQEFKCLLNNKSEVSASKRSLRLPKPPSGLQMQELILNERTRNALDNAGFSGSAAALAEVTIGELLELTGFGIVCLRDLIAAIRLSHADRTSRHRCTIEEDVLCLPQISSPRNRRIIASYYGFGQAPVSLAVAARQACLTKQRVDQLCKAVSLHRAFLLRPGSPANVAAELIKKMIPCCEDVLESKFLDESIIHQGTKVEGVLKLLKVLLEDFEFRPQDFGRVQLLVRADSKLSIASIVQTARNASQRHGATCIQDIVAEVGDRHAPIGENIVNEILKTQEDILWLGSERTWLSLMSPIDTRNPFLRRLSQVLSVAPRVHIVELRNAMRRDYRYGARVPPKRILWELCKHIPICRVEQNYITANRASQLPSGLSGDLSIIVGFLRSNGPLCTFKQLDEFASGAGISRPSLMRHLSHSVPIRRYAREIYGLVGSDVTPGSIEVLTRPKKKQRVLLDHGWTKDRKVWVSYRLSNSTIASGVVALPAAKLEFIRQEYRLRDALGGMVGVLRVSHSSVFGLRPLFSRRGAEPGDYLVLQIPLSDTDASATFCDEAQLEDFLSAQQCKTQ